MQSISFMVRQISRLRLQKATLSQQTGSTTAACFSYSRLLHTTGLIRQKPGGKPGDQKPVPWQAAIPGTEPTKLLKIYEPDYLDHKGHRIPTYDLVNFRLQGYDFPVLEKFEAFVHRTAERMGLEVEDCWGVPAQKLKVTKLKPESSVVDGEYLLNLYERTVQVGDVPTTVLPVLINIVQAALPVGVTLTVKEHEEADEQIRYIPDLELKELKEQLEMDGTALKKKVVRIKISSKFRRTKKEEPKLTPD